MNKFLCIFLFIIIIFSCDSAIIKVKNPEDDEKVSYRWPIISIPLMKNEPVIDGKVEKKEWYSASLLSPLISLKNGIISEDKEKIYIGYTKDKLFIAFQFDRPPYSLKPLFQTEPMAVWRDDCIELFLRDKFGEKWEYSFVGNAVSVFEEGKRVTVTDKNWKIDWEYKSRMTNRGWEGEMAIPFKSLGKIPDIEEIWEIAPINNRKTPTVEQYSWSYLKNWNSHEDLGYLIFGGEIPSIKVLNVGEISRKEMGCIIEISNFTKKDRNLYVDFILYRPKEKIPNFFKFLEETSNPLGPQAETETQMKAKDVVESALKKYEVIKEEKLSFNISPNQTKILPFILNSEIGNYVLYYCVKEKNKILSSSAVPFKIEAPFDIIITPFILSNETIEITANYRRVGGLNDTDLIKVELYTDDGHLLSQTEKKVDLKSFETKLDLSVKGLKKGNYKVKCYIENKAEKEVNYLIPEIPDWWNNKFGYPELTDKVPEPWEPMEKTKNGFKVWNREINLDERLNLIQIKNGKINMLTRPAVIDLKIDREINLKKAECIKQKKTGISYRVEISGGDIKGEILLEAEFDGFMKYTIKLIPISEIKIDKLTFEIPLKKEIITYYHRGCVGTPVSYQETIKDSKDYGEFRNDIFLPFVNEIWIGNDEVGLEYVAETDRFWSLEDKKKAVEVLKKENEVILKINFVDKRKEFNKPVIYQWAILPTPVKPMNKELQRNLFYVQSGFSTDETMEKPAPETERYIEAMVKGGANAFGQWAWKGPRQVWNDDFAVPGYRPTQENEKKKKVFREIIDIAHKKGINWVIVYALFSGVIPDWPGIENFWQEMALFPLHLTVGGYFFCPQKPFSDWYIYTLKKTIEELDIDGVYLDSTPPPKLCSNLHHGCGYVDEDGNLHGTYPVFAYREFHKRIYYLFHGEIKKGGLVYVHNSHFPYMAVESFADIHHCGEGTVLKLEEIVPKFYGYPFGIVVTFTRWNNPVYPETRMNSWRFVLQCDSTIKAHPSYIISKNDYPEAKTSRENFIKGYDKNSIVVWKIWQAQKSFSWEKSEWYPYWKVKEYLETNDEKLLPCMHLNRGKEALVVVSSFKNEVSNCNLKINWGKMGFEWKNVEVKDVITDELLIPNEYGLKFEVLDNRWRMFLIKVKR
jgi:hypothetical protein